MKNTHFFVANQGAAVEKYFDNAFIAVSDGSKSATLKDFIAEAANALEYPDEAGKSLEALEEMLIDLQWIEDQIIVLYINNPAGWLEKEKNEKVFSVIDLLDAIAEDWEWSEDEEDISKKDLKIVFQDSDRIKSLLENQGISYQAL